MFGLCILLLCLGSVSAIGLSEERTHSRKGGFKIDVHVINMESRPERCACMRNQLLNASVREHNAVRVYRQPAAGRKDCPGIKRNKRSKKFAKAERSLWCSNYLIWEKASRSDADYIIVLEDDALLLPGAWDKLSSFLSSPCTFDYVVVDPVYPVSMDPNIERAVPKLALPVAQCPNSFRPTHRKFLWGGTTGTIIRQGFAETLLSKAPEWGWGAMDGWWQSHLRRPNIAFAWKGGFATQASVGKGEEIQPLLKDAGCTNGTVDSSIKHHHREDGRGRADLECPIH